MSTSSLMTEQEAPQEPTYEVRKTMTVSMTGYNAVPGQTDDTPFQTSIGAYTNPEIIVARSADLGDDLPYGTVVKISQIAPKKGCEFDLVQDLIGLRVVADAMHPRWNNKIDVLFDTRPFVKRRDRDLNAAEALGYCKGNIKIEVVGKIDPKKMPKTQSELKQMIGDAQLALK